MLGVILDNKLNWKTHITYITQKVSKSIGILSRARKLLNPVILRQLYYSFLYPYLTYCSIIWGLASASILWPLFRLQKRTIRIICNIKRRESTQIALKKLRIMRLPEIHIFAVLIFMYKYRNGILPTTFNNFYSENQDFHRYPTSGGQSTENSTSKNQTCYFIY